MPLPPGTRLGPYEIVEPLGAGGMGEVYRARDPRLGRDVAVKLVTTDGTPSPDRLRRFETEARAAAQLSHPNVITVFDVGTHDGQPYLVLELLEGKTLRETLRGAAPSLREAVGWGLDAARGLGAAHERGIVHRDLKPENVFLTDDGRIKVLDFGLAKVHEPLVEDAEREAPTEDRGTKPGMVLGTVGYMAPEQVRGETPNARTDVFALGAVVYELVTRRRPFGGSSEGEILAAILRDEPPAPSSVHAAIPPALDGVVRRCLAKAPVERFSSAREVAAALETVLSSLGSGRATARPPEVRGPYPGLESFRESDTERFFGREAEVEALWAKLHERNLLAVIGPSGVGKTSFVRAGVLASRPHGLGGGGVCPWSQSLPEPGPGPGPPAGRRPRRPEPAPGFRGDGDGSGADGALAEVPHRGAAGGGPAGGAVHPQPGGGAGPLCRAHRPGVHGGRRPRGAVHAGRLPHAVQRARRAVAGVHGADAAASAVGGRSASGAGGAGEAGGVQLRGGPGRGDAASGGGGAGGAAAPGLCRVAAVAEAGP